MESYWNVLKELSGERGRREAKVGVIRIYHNNLG